MNHHGITIDETFKEISHSINEGSYSTIDYLFNTVISMAVLFTIAVLIWQFYTLFQIGKDL